MRVLKFGGTSLGHPQRLDTVAGRVRDARQDGPVVLVVSALGGVTDELAEALEAARRGEPSPGLIRRLRARHLDDPAGRLDRAARRRLESELEPWLRELETLVEGIARLGEAPDGARHRLLALGERLAAPRVAAWLRAEGVASAVVDGTALLRTDADLDEPQVAAPRLDVAATRRQVLEGLAGLASGEVPVVTGFIAADVRGRVVTLGRGASDLSATTLAAALEADAVEIWSDTDGVLSADPRRVPSAEPLRRLSFAQAAALARYGAKVLHPETLEPVRRAELPIELRSTFQPQLPGTRLVPALEEEAEPQETAPALAATALDVVHLEARSPSGDALGSGVLGVLERAGLEPLGVTCGRGRFGVWLRAVDADLAEARLRRQLRPLRAGLERRGELTALALLPARASLTSLLAALARCLGERGIAVHALLDGGAGAGEDAELAVAVVEAGVADLALRAVHDALVLRPAGAEEARPEAERVELAA